MMEAEQVTEGAGLLHELRHLDDVLKLLDKQDEAELCLSMGHFLVMGYGPYPSPPACQEIRMILREDFMKRRVAIQARLIELDIKLPPEPDQARKLN